LANDIKLQSPEGKHPVDENLRPILVGDKLTAIETAQHGNGAKISGDLTVTGEIKGKTDIQLEDDITCDEISVRGIHVDGSGIGIVNSTIADIILLDDPCQIISTNLTIDDGGDITLDADGGNITLLDGGSTYTPTATSDATTKTYVDTKYFFSQTMTFSSLATDHDTEWIICNNAAFFKLGGQDTSVDDTETATISHINQAIARTLWFIAPYDMTITHISGNVMDDDLTTHADSNFLGIWAVSSFGTSGNTPTAKTGNQTFRLRYITQDWSASGFGVGDDTSYAFYDASPTLTFSAGDAVWVGHMNFRSSAADASTVSMSIWGYAT
tara:strand:- start:1317 stop:2297 length:981 start_codon:yes stop_codon:yes gene_type:complete